MYIYIFLSVMYIVCVFLFQPRAPVDSRLAIRYLIGLPWVFLNVVKNKSKCGLSRCVLLPTTRRCHYSFPKHFFRIVSAY